MNILKKLSFHLSLSLFIAVSFLFPITKIIDYISKYQPDVTINFFLSNFNSIVMLIVVTVIGLLTGYLNINILKIYILFYYFWPIWYVIKKIHPLNMTINKITFEYERNELFQNKVYNNLKGTAY